MVDLLPTHRRFFWCITPSNRVGTLLLGLGLMGAAAYSHAQVISAGKVPASQRPTIKTPSRGAPIVQIAPPNQHGISHNKYQQLNVGSDGLILSNNPQSYITHQRGTIDANPNLKGRDPARVIINEVTSQQQSTINGPIEIAGHRAALVISNPNGININGMRTFNASRTTLTTGQPIIGSQGLLSTFRVSGGEIRFDGIGLKDLSATRTDLIARNVKINARVWANQLHVITGSNKVDYKTGQVRAINGTETHNVIALDITHLGGMFANKIHLIGTESGIGVKDYGEVLLFAEDFILDQKGGVHTANPAPSKRMKRQSPPPIEFPSHSSLPTNDPYQSPDNQYASPDQAQLPTVEQLNIDFSNGSLDMQILQLLHSASPELTHLPILSVNDLQAHLATNHTQPVDLTPMPLVGGAFGIIPSPMAGAPLGVSASSSPTPTIGITPFPSQASPQPSTSSQLHTPTQVANHWQRTQIVDANQRRQWFTVAGKQDTYPLGIIPVVNPFSQQVGFYVPPAIYIKKISAESISAALPRPPANHTVPASTFIASQHNVQSDYRYWDTFSYMDIFHHSPSITAYLQQFSDGQQVSAGRAREILRLMNTAIGTVDDARRLLHYPEGLGTLTATCDYQGQILETNFNNVEQRITGLRLLPSTPIRSAPTFVPTPANITTAASNSPTPTPVPPTPTPDIRDEL
jgi:filamentous hemagglutinin family protein